MSPCRVLYHFFSFFFFRWICGILQDPNIQNIQEPEYLAKTKAKAKHIRERLGRGTFNTCANVKGPSLENGVDIRR